MPVYMVVRKGEGRGCDYTIGCNENYELVDFPGTLAELMERQAVNTAAKARALAILR